jgi:hypothetical protein
MSERSDSQEVGLEAAILERVRNSSLVECAGADNGAGLKSSAEAADHPAREGRVVVGERCQGGEAAPARGGGALASENAGMSSRRTVNKPSHRMAEVSSARFIHGGLVGPKPRPKGVGDGQTVDSPLPLADGQVHPGCGAG